MQATAYRIAEVDPLCVDAMALLREASIEARELYPELHSPTDPWPTNTPTPPRGAYMVAYLRDQPIAMGAHRPIDEERTEIRRMYVTRSARRSGAARALLRALEAHARAQGFRELLLETGFKQHAAMAFYESHGFSRIAPFGPYASDSTSVCYARSLFAPSEA
jgi:GNAT superfamily N-acetyltransferase